MLVLTHTKAGVVALRGLLDREGVPPRAYRLYTMTGGRCDWSQRSPAEAPTIPTSSSSTTPANDYPNIRVAAAGLLESENVSDILAASYKRIIVDEYQDCSIRQHALIAHAARVPPTCALGDPLQAIFGFGNDRLAAWEDICPCFPLSGELSNPWLWDATDLHPHFARDRQQFGASRA